MVKTNLANDKLECKQQTNSGHDDTPILTQRQHDNNTTNAIPTTPQQQHNGTVPGPPPNVRIQASKRPSFQALLGSIVSHKTFSYVCWQKDKQQRNKPTTTNPTTTKTNQQQQTQQQHTPKSTDRQTDRRTYTRHTTHTSA